MEWYKKLRDRINDHLRLFDIIKHLKLKTLHKEEVVYK